MVARLPACVPLRLDVPLQQLPAALGDRVWIDAQQVRDPGIAAFNSCANTPSVTRSNSPAIIWRRATLCR
jgi:hypothetical protein